MRNPDSRIDRRPPPGSLALLPILSALFVALALALSGIVAGPAAAQTDTPAAVPPPAPPTGVVAHDAPNDAGGVLVLEWNASRDASRTDILHGYRVLRAESGGPFEFVAEVSPDAVRLSRNSLTDGAAYAFKVVAFGPGGEGESGASSPVSPSAQWINSERINIGILMILVCGAIISYIVRARRGEKMYIRKIAGMDAVTEAVGRATEMGQPILYIAGTQDLDNVQTVTGLTILGSISKMIAEYETSLLMPTSRSLVMSTARETVKESYLAVGRPDAYREDSIYYVTDEQFGFVAHVDGLMLRKKPATCFYFGAFFAESLILAETGNSIGAIQVAGTAMPTQLPFFVAACDYTLIGEELFAASAYLSQDEMMLGSLRGQDAGKLLAMVFILVGSVVATFDQFVDGGAINQVAAFLDWLWTGAAAGGH